jgi:hypothetical protein
VTELDIARARLRFHAAIAAAVRKQCNLELTPRGYRPLREMVSRMQVRLPKDVEMVRRLRRDDGRGTWIVKILRVGELTPEVIEVPQIDIDRYRRRGGEVR